MSHASYTVPQGLSTAEIEIKKSRFIALAKGIETREAGMSWLESVKADYPDARHHCWAYIIGNPACASNAGMGDDGEPSGTAGKPILNVLQHKGIGDIMLIVVRYFGGIKLGAGGLTRAYGQAAQAVMQGLPIQQKIVMQSLIVHCDYGQEQGIRHWLATHQGQVMDVDYSSLPMTMHIALPEQQSPLFTEQLNTLTGIYWQKAND
jgi:uncharacterized YigZ family protein